MNPELAARLHRTFRMPQKTGVAGVASVAPMPATCVKPLKSQRLRPLRAENDEMRKDVTSGVAGGVARLLSNVSSLHEPDDAEIDERAGLCADSIPTIYLDAWARLNCRKPELIAEAEWRQALDDGGRFLDSWGNLAVEMGCAASELLDPPCTGYPGGLIWRLRGYSAQSFGPSHVLLGDGNNIEFKSFDLEKRGTSSRATSTP